MSLFLILSILVSTAWSAPFDFLAEVEDVEKEMWWVVSQRRIHSSGTPYRALQKALNEDVSKKKSPIKLSTCNRFQVDGQVTQSYRVTSLCLSQPQWIGSLEQTSKDKDREVWKLVIPLQAWTSHFGVGVSIFHPQLICELNVSPQKRLLKMTCPIYARNRTAEEFVELTDFQFEKNGMPVMKIDGHIKQPPEIIGKIESVVPIDGDIRIKETRYPKKQEVLEKIEFNHSQKGDPHGKKEKIEKEVNPQEKSNNQEEGHGQEEAPPIKPEAPPPTR
jgi:hypothetical protein